ncbi:hypothetical protein N657DRAFT_637816 [Parathielavia appendiculata]|uniref:Cytochrome P450 n=1 Tax=Parathielavia appendiculata TaxID=2587402 RepID=A0AAN6TR13_9PEZI|nr:hypothetical protein N657DRAFT_637816 [Parathielavia appendiculata]
MFVTTLVWAAALCLVLLIVLLFRKWRARQIQGWVQEQRRVASFQYAESLGIDERLHLRAVENRRLKAAFGIDNSLTTPLRSTHRQFLHASNAVLNGKYRSWEKLYRIAETFLDMEVSTQDSLPLAETVRCMVLAVVLFDSFDVDPISVPRSTLVTITNEINKQWMLSKCHPDDLAPSALLNSTIASLNIRRQLILSYSPHFTSRPESVLSLLMPQYETLWRVVLLTFATAFHHQPDAYPDVFQRTADVPSCLGDPSREKEALKLAKEGLRLYPSNKRLYRASLTSSSNNNNNNNNNNNSSSSSNFPPVPVAADISALHRHPSIWGADALAFRPGRFDDGQMTDLQREAYIPFSVKPHKCPAASNAFGERMVVVLVSALGRVLGPDKGRARFEESGRGHWQGGVWRHWI